MQFSLLRLGNKPRKICLKLLSACFPLAAQCQLCELGKIYNTAGTSRERQTKYESTDDFPNVINTTSVYDSKDFKDRFRSGIYVFKRTPPNNSSASEREKEEMKFRRSSVATFKNTFFLLLES